MYRVAKNIVKNLVVSKEVAILAMRTSREYTATKDILVSCSKVFGRSLVALLHSCSRGWFAKHRGCALFLYPYVKRIFDLQCEPASKMRIWAIVPASHPTSKVPICTAATYVRRYLFSALTRLTIRMSTARRTHGTPSDISSPTSETLTPIIPCL